MGQVHQLAPRLEQPIGDAPQWRQDRPLEDPEKTKRWGRITAKPSEYLVVMRRGRVRERHSGQGASYFKWPKDSVAVVPTSLQKLAFTADQVTTEKVGVAVTGLAVYRIVDPLLAFRVLNFAYPERAQQKLEETLTSMFIGATRRLVANLTVEECLQKRKSALAEELIREVAPVVGGEGRAGDRTDKGWGIVIDTIEVQEVRVLSERVFSAMQAPFRQALDQRAHEARAESERHMALKSTEYELDVQKAKIDAEMESERRKRELDEARAAAEKERELRALRSQEEVARAQREVELRAAREDIEVAELRRESLALRVELERSEQSADVARREQEAELERLEARVRAEGALGEAQAEAERARARAELLRAEKLPELAAAVGQRFGEVKITQLGAGDTPFAGVTQAVAAVMALAREG